MTVRIQLHPNALYEVRRMPGARAEVMRHAERIATASGSGYAWGSQQGRKAPQGRWRAIVYPETWAARWDLGRNNTLLRNLGGG
ncbi:hypothetical protein [Cellulomonas sp. NPDC058312]|uniref:hypothetical protein n=1 Tax=Cellulomonas sp. NPDC058312 TaxID=3346441 RepID=UPI0036EFB3AD